VIEAACATDGYAYASALEGGLLSRLDHAAYPGRELARSEHALDSGTRHQQDSAPG
jgi:tetrahydromethanopterin S-methyltransferase subunit A